MPLKIELNQVLVPTRSGSTLSGPHRILAVSPDQDLAWLIPLPSPIGGEEYRYYQYGVVTLPLAALQEDLEQGHVCTAEHRLPPHWLLSDDDYINAAHPYGEQERRQKRLKTRDEKWALIERIFRERTIPSVARHYGSLNSELAAIARMNNLSVACVRRALNLYLASGGVKNALIPKTENCGAAGTTRKVKKPTGRPKKSGDGASASSNYILSDRDKERCADGYLLRKTGRTDRSAYLTASAAFWSEHIIDENGVHKAMLLPSHHRPSLQQFTYWGKKGGPMAEARIAGSRRRNDPSGVSTRRGGASTDITSVVGVNAMFDGTSNDVYLVSIYSRNRVLPPMTRLIIKEPISSAVIGVHCDWQPPSPNAALKAIHAAAQDKHELCSKYGVDCPPGSWPGLLCKSYLADNGELRAKEITEAESVFGFSVEYAKTYDGASKGDVETQHKSDHVAVDHAIPGTTRGRKHKRGEPHPADSAILNHYEYMQMLLRHYIAYNNELVPDRAPLAMIQAGIPPTRINVLKWYRDTYQSAELTADLEHMRAYTLYRWPAVIRETGIFLKSTDRKRVYHGHRFFSRELKDDKRFQDVQSSRRAKDVTVHVGAGIDHIWLPTEAGMIMLANTSADTASVDMTCLADLDDYSKQRLAAERGGRHVDEQMDLDELMEREATITRAKQEQRDENRGSARKPSNRARKSNLRKNAHDERRALGAFDSVSTERELERSRSGSPGAAEKPSRDAADLAAEEFLRTLP
jgi:hypothetical protein